MVKNHYFVLAAAMSAAMLVSCSQDDPADGGSYAADAQEIALRPVVEDYVNNTVVPTYRGLADASLRRAAKCDEMCAAGVGNLTPDMVAEAGRLWIEARRYWELSEAWLFGAAADYNIDPHIDTWPLDRTAMEAMLGNP